MKRWHLPLLLLCGLLLAGCGKADPAPTEELQPVTLYQPGSDLELETKGAVRAYPLNVPDACGLKAMGSRVLVLSGESETTLTVLAGEEGRVVGTLALDIRLDPDDPSLQMKKDGLSYYDPKRRETVELDRDLRELRRVAAPLDMTGSPLLSGDGQTLYYCTADAIRAWDLDSGIRRMVKAGISGSHTLTGLHEQDRVLSWELDGRSLLISTEDGHLLHESEHPLTLDTGGGLYYAALELGQQQLLLYGQGEKMPTLLTPAGLERGAFLGCLHGAVTVNGQTLSYYNLSTGRRASILTLDREPLGVVDTRDGWVYVLTRETLYRWDVRSLPAGDTETYTAPYGDENLNRCRGLARKIGEKYGIRVLVGQEAADRQPWDYEFTPELLTGPTYRQLELLDECLSNYPSALLEDTLAPFSSLTICLVREIAGAPASGSVAAANGLQFRTDTDVTLALSVGPRSDRALYHELFHVMETRLLTQSTAFDRWDTLNPRGFDYDYSYTTPRGPEAENFTRGKDAVFVDVYSMTYPKEDRARIMEYAMCGGNEEVFASNALQAKLRTVCTAIREAYGLEDSRETFRWEQYLDQRT